MANTDKVQKTKCKVKIVKSDTSDIPSEERLRIIANIIIDKILEEYQQGKLQFRSNTNG